jgi:predicted enzyme related to lactoylglutathione lyase
MLQLHLNHLDLQVTDVPAAAAFFVHHFGFTLASNGTSPALAILSDAAGFSLVLQRQQHADERYPEGFHFGFIVDTVDAVHAQRARLIESGVAGVGEIIVNGRGTMFYMRGPSDLVIEVSVRRAPARPR